jgi:hypothetical protein
MSNEKSGRTGKFCVAAGCTSTHKDNLSLHEFPKENVRPNIRRQWIKFVQVKRKDFIKPTANSVLCEKHFPPGSYPVEYELKKAMNLPVRKKCLLPDAVPTMVHTYGAMFNDNDVTKRLWSGKFCIYFACDLFHTCSSKSVASSQENENSIQKKGVCKNK